MSCVRWCPECGASEPAERAEDKLCARCQAIEDAIYANDPAPPIDTEPRPFSRRWMQERLGVTGNTDD
jgi:hypothetical protein